LRQRIDKLGVSEPVVTKQGANQIVIELPAVHNINEAAQIIGKTAQLELYDLTPSLLPPSVDASQNAAATTSIFNLLSRVQTGQKGTPTAYYLFNTKTKKLVAGPPDTPPKLRKSRGGQVPEGTQVLTVPPKAAVIPRHAAV